LFPWSEDSSECKCVKQELRNSIAKAIEDGYQYFIAGGATGVDTWAAEIILDMKNKGMEIFLEIAKPWQNYNENLGQRYQDIERAADYITEISTQDDFRKAFEKRDHYMIDNSQRITVVYDDESKVFSGTYRALLYAKTKETEIIQCLL
jgi:uncharacterized phage-like protein YoqJ